MLEDPEKPEEKTARSTVTDVRNTYTTLGSNEMHANGVAGYLSNPATAVNGVIYVPLTYLSECLGFNVASFGDGVWAISRILTPDASSASTALKVMG